MDVYIVWLSSAAHSAIHLFESLQMSGLTAGAPSGIQGWAHTAFLTSNVVSLCMLSTRDACHSLSSQLCFPVPVQGEKEKQIKGRHE